MAVVAVSKPLAWPLPAGHSALRARQGPGQRNPLFAARRSAGLGAHQQGPPEMGNPVYEYEYVDLYIKRSYFGLLMLDLSMPV